jgi:hypothetical protein
MELAGSSLTRYQMEEVSTALEKLKLFLPRNGEGTEGEASGDQLAELADKFVARLTGKEAEPPAFSAKTGQPALNSDRYNRDLSEDFQKLLGYELEYMRDYRQPGEHPLSVIGRLLDALTARYHLADEVFVAHLLYFLQAQNYPVGPYLEKFRQVKSRVKKK